MCHNMETSYMDFGYDAYNQSYPNTTNISPVEMNITPTVGGNNAVVKPEDDDDPDSSENVPHENSMQVAAQGLKDEAEDMVLEETLRNPRPYMCVSQYKYSMHHTYLI